MEYRYTAFSLRYDLDALRIQNVLLIRNYNVDIEH